MPTTSRKAASKKNGAKPKPQVSELGKALRKRLEQAFYEKYFESATWFRDIERIEALARVEAA